MMPEDLRPESRVTYEKLANAWKEADEEARKSFKYIFFEVPAELDFIEQQNRVRERGGWFAEGDLPWE